jgi:ATP-dependent DNA ligase
MRTPRNTEGSRWSPERILEVNYDHMEGERFRHTAQFVRWRPGQDPQSCTYDPL